MPTIGEVKQEARAAENNGQYSISVKIYERILKSLEREPPSDQIQRDINLVKKRIARCRELAKTADR